MLVLHFDWPHLACRDQGLGTQYELPISIDILLKRGVIEKVP
jgi:hypothetical protein